MGGSGGRRASAVRYDLSYDSQRERWYLDASWTIVPDPPTALNELQAGRVLGVDLNADHLACCVLDSSGNPIGEPTTIASVHGRFARDAARWARACGDHWPA